MSELNEVAHISEITDEELKEALDEIFALAGNEIGQVYANRKQALEHVGAIREEVYRRLGLPLPRLLNPTEPT